MDIRKLSKVTDSHIKNTRICDSELDQLVDQVWEEISGMDEAGGVEAGEIEGLKVNVFIDSEEWPEVSITVGENTRTWNAESFEGKEETLYKEQKKFIKKELSKTNRKSNKFYYTEAEAIAEAERVAKELGSEWEFEQKYGRIWWWAYHDKDAESKQKLERKALEDLEIVRKSFQEPHLGWNTADTAVYIIADYEPLRDAKQPK